MSFVRETFMKLLLLALTSVLWSRGSAAADCPTGAPTCLTTQGSWPTTLHPRDHDGDGTFDAYYDSLLDLTWLADANYAITSGADYDGKMSWFAATSWVDGLQLFGGTEWRLPTVTPVNGVSFNYTNAFDGSTDIGYALQNVGWGTASELGHMYYVTLGNDGLGDGTYRPDSTGPFRNLLEGFYFTNVPYAPSSLMVWGMDMDNGRQSTVFKQNLGGGGDDGGGVNLGSYAWAVHDGDLIGPPTSEPPATQQVPIPVGLTFTLGAALAGFGATRKACG